MSSFNIPELCNCNIIFKKNVLSWNFAILCNGVSLHMSKIYKLCLCSLKNLIKLFWYTLVFSEIKFFDTALFDDKFLIKQ
jgi:hypothetical protein